ncbi:MAG TPA: class I SAM-dependent methyltransferase [Halothiobacillus sp.]|nr:class I SAM-dependent methyltransferase [Halothiobacillus sp.]
MVKNTLQDLYAKHQGKVSDKWSLYLAEYERLFSYFRNSPVRLLEIGVQNGGSLEIWGCYFPRPERLVGCDINTDCHKLAYDDPRISVVVGDANDEETKNNILDCSPAFDVIIDDGSHRSSDIVKSFVHYFPHLADEGVYVAEDLHCSYWQEFEGGLYDPYSAISFFKCLSDVVSHEHWGVNKTREELLSEFSRNYGVMFDETALSQIHSVEFINSMCVIRKSPSEKNRLGKRVISGNQALVVDGVLGLQSTLSVAPSQIENQWANLPKAPGEEFMSLKSRLGGSEAHISDLEVKLRSKDAELRSKDAQLTEKEDFLASILTSRSWCITAPLRQAGIVLKRLVRVLKK